VLTLGDAAGLFLPQVAAEMGWNREQFLTGLSQKAGLLPDAYRDKRAKLYVFEAQVFGE
jgi:AMMECR1 domain-containing protein